MVWRMLEQSRIYVVCSSRRVALRYLRRTTLTEEDRSSVGLCTTRGMAEIRRTRKTSAVFANHQCVPGTNGIESENIIIWATMRIRPTNVTVGVFCWLGHWLTWKSLCRSPSVAPRCSGVSKFVVWSMSGCGNARTHGRSFPKLFLCICVLQKSKSI